jgi:hypothetical protein
LLQFCLLLAASIHSMLLAAGVFEILFAAVAVQLLRLETNGAVDVHVPLGAVC